MAESDVYLLGRSPVEEERLRQQAEELAGETRWLLDQLDIRPGAKAIELGCGPQGALDMLSERVGPRGTVVGLERSDHFVASARKFVADRRLVNVEVIQGDAKATELPRESFDVVFTRLVLVNVPEPERIVAEMAALVRPGGAVVSYEADYLPHLCDPPSPAWDRLFEIFQTHSRQNAVDLFVGRKTHRMLLDAGIEDVQVSPTIHSYPHGNRRRTIFLDFIRNVRAPMIAAHLIDEREFAELTEALQRHLDDPRTLVVSHIFFRTWGRKPVR